MDLDDIDNNNDNNNDDIDIMNQVIEDVPEETNPVDNLIYKTTTLEVDIEKFLSVDSWNEKHGISWTSEIMDDQVEAVKQAREAGDNRRHQIRLGFAQGERALMGMEKAMKAIADKLDKEAQELKEELGEDDDNDDVASTTSTLKLNGFSKESVQNVQVRGAAKARIDRLKNENDILKQCLQQGSKNSSSSFVRYLDLVRTDTKGTVQTV